MLPPRLDLALRRSHDLRNALHTVLLIGGLALLLAFIAWTVLGWTGLVWAAILGAFGLWSMGHASPRMVLGLYKARALRPDELPDLHQLVQELARRAELPAAPKLYYVPSKILNAFAVGRPQESAIAVTDGILRAMTMRQLAGILAHETAHIRSGDLKVMALADVLTRITSTMAVAGLIGIPLFFGAGMDIPWFGILALIFAPTLGGLLQLALSRTREYDADLDGAALTGDPKGLASALDTLERRQGRVWEGLFPGGRVPSPSLLRTHPATRDRVARLLALAGETEPQIVVSGDAKPVPGPSIVPPIRNPRIHWQRMGIWY